jgi:hypothetical protein
MVGQVGKRFPGDGQMGRPFEFGCFDEPLVVGLFFEAIDYR